MKTAITHIAVDLTNEDETGDLEGFGLWVEPSEFIAGGYSDEAFYL